MNKHLKRAVLPALLLFLLLFQSNQALAEHVSLSLKNGEEAEYSMSVGDTGTLSPDCSETALPVTNWSYYCSDTDILTIDQSGQFTALAPGRTWVTIYGYGSETVYDYDTGEEPEEYVYDSYELFEAQCMITVYPDMSGVTLGKESVTGYITPYDYDCDLSVSIKGNNGAPFSYENASFSYDSSNKNMNLYCSLSDNTIYLSCYNSGTTDLSITINGRTFPLKVTVYQVKINSSSVLLTKSQTKQLKVSGIPAKITWKSSNPKIATVSSKGVVKGKKTGNVIITAKAGDTRLGCVVSVTTTKVKKTIAKAKKIGATCKYSQAKRMSAGYYDCSSLVWKAYSPNGVRFGSSSYAPTSRNQAKWCKDHHRIVKGGFSSKNLQKLSLLPGDLMFESSDPENLYGSIYHVEMFTGYTFEGFDSAGKPIVGSQWANRSQNYYYPGGQLMGRPAL